MTHPRELKGKHMICGDTDFVVASGKQTAIGWILLDHEKRKFKLQDSHPIAQIKAEILACRLPAQYDKIIGNYGMIVSSTIWNQLSEEYSAKMAAISVSLYADSWASFNSIVDGYGASKSQDETLNSEFRNICEAFGLNGKIRQWYEDSQPVQMEIVAQTKNQAELKAWADKVGTAYQKYSKIAKDHGLL